jgi:hypothetical protein
MTIENEKGVEITEESYVYIVKESDSTVSVFATLDAAKAYVLRKIGEIKDNFISSSWRINVVSDEYIYKIKTFTWYLVFFYYETTIHTFEVEQQVIRF